MSNENLYKDTATPAPNAVPASGEDVLLNEIAAIHGGMAQLRQIMARGMLELAQRVVALEERDEADRLERPERQRHLDRLLWAGLGLAGAHLLLEAIQLLRGRS
jgi:hypothetical protein